MNQQFVRLGFLFVAVGLAGLLLVMLPLIAATPSAVSFAAGDASFRLDAIFGDIDLAPSSPRHAFSDAAQTPDINRAVDTPSAAVSSRGLQGGTPAHAGPGTLYVDEATGSDTTDCTNPAAPCATIGYALTQAGNGDEIRVAEGTYMETLDIHITVTLKGGYEAAGWTRDIAAHPTIVDANGADDSVISIYDPGTIVTVEGFTVQGANHTSDWGGGLCIVNATVVISGTVIRDNSTDGSGGGFFISEGDAEVSLINSTVTANVAKTGGGSSGLAAGFGADRVTILDTIFTGNTGDGVLWIDDGVAFDIIGGQVVSNTVSGFAAINLAGSGTISGTEIVSNTFRAMSVSPTGAVSALSLTIRGNTGGGIANQGVLTITNSFWAVRVRSR